MFKKKSQGALEFLMIFIFALAIISAIIYVIGLVSIDISKNKEKKEILNFADNIISEFNFAKKLSGGFIRKELLYETTNPKFEIIIDNNFNSMKIIDLKSPNLETIFYYEFGINSQVKISVEQLDTNSNGVNETYVVLYKPQIINYNGIDITSEGN